MNRYQLGVDFDLEQRDLNLSERDFEARFVEPAICAIQNKLEDEGNAVLEVPELPRGCIRVKHIDIPRRGKARLIVVWQPDQFRDGECIKVPGLIGRVDVLYRKTADEVVAA